MAFVESQVRLPCTGIGALGLLRLASIRGSPGKLNIVVPSVKKSTYFEPMTCTSFNAGVVEAVSAAAVLEADVERFGPMSGRPIASPASVDVALVDVAVKATTKSVLNAQKVRLVRRRLAAENAIVWVFMPLT
jgi:hypothetical protein